MKKKTKHARRGPSPKKAKGKVANRPARAAAAKAHPPDTPKPSRRPLLIKKPGIYPGMSAADYHADPCDTPSVSASLLKIVDQSSPAHAWRDHPKLNPEWKPSASSRDMDFGTAAHAAVLGEDLVVLPYKDWRTDIAKATREAHRQASRPFVLKADVVRLKGMVAKLKGELADVDVGGRKIGDVMGKDVGENECVAVWKESGVMCRARADRWIRPGEMKEWPDGLIIDYKATGDLAAPDVWARAVFNIGADFQSTWYPAGFNMAWNQSGGRTLLKLPAFLYVVQEWDAPYEFMVLAPSEISTEHTTNKISAAFAAWVNASRSLLWPGYPRHVAYFDPPPWELKREEMRAIAAQVASRPL